MKFSHGLDHPIILSYFIQRRRSMVYCTKNICVERAASIFFPASLNRIGCLREGHRKGLGRKEEGRRRGKEGGEMDNTNQFNCAVEICNKLKIKQYLKKIIIF